MTAQSSRHMLVIEPAEFRYNPETASTNIYQHEDKTLPEDILAKGLAEFRAFRDNLVANGVYVSTLKGIKGCPDHIFCNWVSTHDDGTMVLYPMMADSRRRERTPDMVHWLQNYYTLKHDFRVRENEGLYLESTGSLVLDRVNRIAYCALSERTNAAMAEEWARAMDYHLVVFETSLHGGVPVYHTDLVLFIGTKVAGLAYDAIIPADRERVRNFLMQTHEVVTMSDEQMGRFACNSLEVLGDENQPMLAISQAAYNSLKPEQISRFSRYFTRFIVTDIPTIERYGGGSCRCILQELF